MITARECAEAIVNGVENKSKVVITPKWYSIVVFLRKFFPNFVDNVLIKMFASNKKKRN